MKGEIMMTSIRKAFLATLSCAAVASAFGAAPATIPSVRVEKVADVLETEPKVYVGQVDASESVDIVARVNGTLWKVAFKEGSLVKKGDLLFKIEDTIYKENVNVAKSTIKQTESELEYATKEKNRFEQLYKSNATAQTTYEDALRSYQVNQAKLDEARANLVLAENDLSYTTIYSPISGQIGEKVFSEGNYITPEKGSLVTIRQFDPIDIKFSMSSADFFKYSKNGTFSDANMKIIRADGKVCERPVKIDFIDNQVDSNTGTLMIQLKMDNPDRLLIPGDYVMVNFSNVFEKPVPAVSVTALMTDGEKHFVYVVGDGNKIERRVVEIGPQVKGKQVILSGLKEGETVVVGGIQKAKPGEEVNPVFASVVQAGN